MKTFKCMALSFVLAFWLVIGISISDAGAFTYLGDFRWKVTWSDGGDDIDIFSLGVFDMGGGHILLSGRVEGCECIVQGSAEMIGSNYILLLNSVTDDVDTSPEAMEAQIWRVILSSSTLNGTYKQFYTDEGQGTSSAHTQHDSGTFEFLGPK